MKRELMGGINAVEALLQRSPERMVRLWVKPDQNARLSALWDQAKALGVPVEVADDRALSRRLSDIPHQGVVAEFQPQAAIDEHALNELVANHPNPLLLVLDEVQDPHNLGACIRSAAAAGALAVVTTKDRASGLTAAARKASAGASEWLPLAVVTNLARALDQLKEAGLWTVGLVMAEGESLFSPDISKWFESGVVLVVGGEGKGLRRLTAERCDRLVSIPMPGETESLNVSVAAAIALFSVVRARGAGSATA